VTSHKRWEESKREMRSLVRTTAAQNRVRDEVERCGWIQVQEKSVHMEDFPGTLIL
jgi:hypothetical protein